MKKSMKSKMLVAVMTLAMVFPMIPMMGAPAYADDPAPAAPGIALGADVLGVGSNRSGAATVHMADTTWRVIGYNGSGVASSADTMTLIAADNLKTGVQFNPNDNKVNTYKDSNLYNEVNSLTDDTNGVFSKGEKEGIVSRDLEPGEYSGTRPYTNGIAGEEVEGALLWPLSTQEAYYMDSELRKASSYWWLRSPGLYNHIAPNVGGVGDVDIYGITVDGRYGVRTAFNFNLKSVIFTSAATGGKSSKGVGAGALKPVGSNSTNDWKLTVQSGHEGFKITSSSYDNTNHVLTVYYSGAVTSPDGNEYVSAVVVDKDGKITHYGNIKQCKSDGDASGQIEINLDGVLSCGNDTEVYVFNEQLNGDKKTDYASKLIEITVPATAEHNYEWEYIDDENHKGVCNVCGEEITEKHTYSQGRCTVCNGACGHSSLNDSYSHDLEKHWKTCAYCGNVIEHEEHAWQDEWTADGTKHWHECEVCQRKKDEENHKWDAGTVTTQPTTEADGVRTYTCTVCNAERTEPIAKLPAYEAKDSTGNAIQTLSWQKGSGKSLDFTIECDIDDSQTYGKFTGLEIDGEPVADSDYTAAKGSLKLSIKPSYLETLSAGDHSMKAKFSDGSTELTLRVLAAADKKDDKGKPGKVSPKSGTKTGDDSNLLLWYTLLFSSLIVLLGGVVIQRRYGRRAETSWRRIQR